MPYETPGDPRTRLSRNPRFRDNPGGPGNPGGVNNMPRDPFNQYGYSGQSPSLGRYVPPMMSDYNNPNSWMNSGGYAYNIPNSYGNPQYTRFNASGMPNPQFGQSQNIPSPDWRTNPPPQLDPQQASVMQMFMGLPGMSSVTQPYREQLTRPSIPQPQVGQFNMSGGAKPLNNFDNFAQTRTTQPVLDPGGKVMGSPGEGGMLGVQSGGGMGEGGGGGGVRDFFGRVGQGLRNFGNVVRRELADRSGGPGWSPIPTPAGQPYFGAPSLSAGGGPVGPAPGYNPYNTYAGSPGLGPTPGGGSIPNPYLSNQSPAPGQPTGPEQGGYTPYSFGGNQGSQLGPTPSGGMRAPPRSTRGATGYRLNVAMQGINALRDQSGLEAMNLRNYGALRQ